MDEHSTRQHWLRILERLARPVLSAQAAGRLRASMPCVAGPREELNHRSDFAPLEAIGRLLAGIAPWLQGSGGETEELRLRDDLAELTLAALSVGFDPDGPDPLCVDEDEQCVVDLSFIALGLLRAPTRLLQKLPERTRANLIGALCRVRRHPPCYNNHLLFAALNEALLAELGEPFDRMRIDCALRAMDSWYIGDGIYCDGPEFRQDYYQSYVIHPYFLALADVFTGRDDYPQAWQDIFGKARVRARRVAFQQARQIAPDGTFPIVGRSITYRCGAFHLLADMAWRHDLPPHCTPAAARCALTAVIRRSLDVSGTFDAEGWLTIVLAGHQPALAESYINTGSTYLCAFALLPLGLAPTDPFWSDADEALPWEQVWAGAFPADRALDHAAEDYGGTGR